MLNLASPPTLLAVALIATAFTAGAQQQESGAVFVTSDIRIGGGGLGGDRSFRPVMTERELKRYGQVLELDETQSVLANEMLGSYRQTFEAEANRVRDRMNDIREEAQATGDFTVFGREMGPVMEEWNRTSEGLQNDLLANLKSLLREDQVERWPVFEREKRRTDLLPNSRLGGEDVDLVLLMGDLELESDTSSRLEAMLEQYAVELDVALKSRETVIPPLQQEMFEKMGDREAVEKIWEQGTRKRMAVREINERYLAMLMAELDEETAGKLQHAFLERSYPLAFDETKAHKWLEAVRTLDSLDESQVAAITELESGFLTRLDALSTRLIEEIRKEEEEVPPFIQNMRPPSERGGGAMQVVFAAEGSDQYDGLLTERFNLSKTTITQIESLLTPEQKGSLPEIDMEEAANRVFLRGLKFNL